MFHLIPQRQSKAEADIHCLSCLPLSAHAWRCSIYSAKRWKNLSYGLILKLSKKKESVVVGTDAIPSTSAKSWMKVSVFVFCLSCSCFQNPLPPRIPQPGSPQHLPCALWDWHCKYSEVLFSDVIEHFVPHREEGESRCLQFDSAHDHVSFSCAIPTHPISKTTGQFHQPYCYSLPPLQRPARCSIRTWPAKSWCSVIRLPIFGLSRTLRDTGDTAGSSSIATTWSTW